MSKTITLPLEEYEKLVEQVMFNTGKQYSFIIATPYKGYTRFNGLEIGNLISRVDNDSLDGFYDDIKKLFEETLNKHSNEELIYTQNSFNHYKKEYDKLRNRSLMSRIFNWDE